MGRHVLVLPPVATQNAFPDGGLSEVRVQAVFVASVGRLIGEVHWIGRTLLHTGPRQIVPVKFRRAVNHTHVSSLVGVQGRVLGAFPHASPGRIVGVGPSGTLLHAAHGDRIREGVRGALLDAEGGGVVRERLPEGAVGHALAGGVLSVGVRGTPEDARPGVVFGVGPGLIGTDLYAPLCGVVGVGPDTVDAHFGTDRHAPPGDLVRVGH